MKISTKGQYGLRAMIDLAINSTSRHVSLNSIAERQNISLNYLEQVFANLRKAGLVKSVKGAQGGYLLTRSLCDISVGKILRVLEGNLSIIDENESNDNRNHIEDLIFEKVWNKINFSIDAVVDSITIEELVTEYRAKMENTEMMFYI